MFSETAFQNKPLKPQLDERIVRDITAFVSQRFNKTPTEVRKAVTSKCAAETKMMRQRRNWN